MSLTLETIIGLRMSLALGTITKLGVDYRNVLFWLDVITLMCDFLCVIESFADKETERVFGGRVSRRFPPEIQRRALNKLRVLHAIVRIGELLDPPSNRLEALRGDRDGQFSIRINNQWRICFRWESGNAHDVEITDYH